MSIWDVTGRSELRAGEQVLSTTDPGYRAASEDLGISILLIDPWLVTRRSLAHLLSEMPEKPRVETAATLPAMYSDNLDVLLINLHSTHIEDIGPIFPHSPHRHSGAPPIVIITDVESVSAAEAAIHYPGVRGYLTTSLKPAILLAALRLVLAGGTYMPAELRANISVVPASVAPDDKPAAIDGFTARELDVLRLLREGQPNKLIAYQLRISENTAKVHVRNIMRKLRATNRTQVAIRTEWECQPLGGPAARIA